MSRLNLNTAFSGISKLREWWPIVKTNFNAIVSGHNDLENRVDTIVAGAGESNTEIVDARASTVKSKTFATLDARLEESEQDVASHTAEIVDARHSTAKSKDFTVLTDRLEEIETDAASHTAEIVDARHSTAKSKDFTVLTDRLEEIETDAASHMAESVTDIGGVHGVIIEQGSWTPYLFGEDNFGEHEYGAGNLGEFQRIGNIVYIYGSLRLLQLDTTMSGNVRIGGLPFNCSGSVPIALSRIQRIKFNANSKYMAAHAYGGAIHLLFPENDSNPIYATTDNFANTTWIFFSGVYGIS